MTKKRSYGAMLGHDERLAINEALRKMGFDGNGRFDSITEALSIAQGVLDGFGIEVDQVLSANEFKKKRGTSMVYLAFSNKKDPFSPTSIENAALSFQWYTHTSPAWHGLTMLEVIAYVS